MASGVKYLSLDYYRCEHLLTMQIASTGTVSRVSLMTDKASNFLPSAAQIAPDSMLTRLDRLCELLGDTLREVVIALFPWEEDDFHELQSDPVKPMRGLRDQMPSMGRRQRLVFRMSRKWGYVMFDSEYDAVCKAVFDRKSQYWTNIALDD